MPRGVLAAGGLHAIKHVLNHRAPEQGRGQRVLAHRFERLDAGPLPLVVGGKCEEVQVIVTRGLGGASLSPCLFQRGKRLGRQRAGGERSPRLGGACTAP
jgi:hypothetical protein